MGSCGKENDDKFDKKHVLWPHHFAVPQIREQNRFDVTSSGPRSQHLAGIPIDEPRKARIISQKDFSKLVIFDIELLFRKISDCSNGK